MHSKVLALIVMFENDKVDLEKARTLLESIEEQAEACGNTEALKFAQKASSMIPEEGDADPGLMDTLGDLVWAIAKQDIEPIERFLVERHRDKGFTVEHIPALRRNMVMTEHLSLDRFRLFVWLRTPDKTVNEVGFLDDDRKPHVIDCRPLVNADADEEAQFKTIREELKAMGI